MGNVHTPKRSHVNGETPPDLRQKHKREKTTTATSKRAQQTKPSMAQVVVDASLTIAVVDMPIPGMITPLNKEKYDMIYKEIDSLILQTILANNGSTIPKFDENRFTRNVMKVRCSTPAAKAWITGVVGYIKPLWNEMRLQVIDFDQLPQPKKILGTFQNCSMDNRMVLQMLGVMNPCININHWSIVKRQLSKNGVHITFSMHEDQIPVLKSVNFQLHFGAGMAIFMDISRKEHNTNAQPEGEADNEDEADMVTEHTDEKDVSIEYTDAEKADMDNNQATASPVINDHAQMQADLATQGNTIEQTTSNEGIVSYDDSMEGAKSK